MVAHIFNPRTQEAGGFLEFKTSPVYRASSRTATATKRNFVSFCFCLKIKTITKREANMERMSINHI